MDVNCDPRLFLEHQDAGTGRLPESPLTKAAVSEPLSTSTEGLAAPESPTPTPTVSTTLDNNISIDDKISQLLEGMSIELCSPPRLLGHSFSIS